MMCIGGRGLLIGKQGSGEGELGVKVSLVSSPVSYPGRHHNGGRERELRFHRENCVSFGREMPLGNSRADGRATAVFLVVLRLCLPIHGWADISFRAGDAPCEPWNPIYLDVSPRDLTGLTRSRFEISFNSRDCSMATCEFSCSYPLSQSINPQLASRGFRIG